MAPDSSQQRTEVSLTGKGAEASAEENDGEIVKTLKTFSFDASAGASAGIVVSSKEKKSKVAQPVPSNQTVVVLDIDSGAKSDRPKKAPTTVRRRLPSWLTSSLAVHGVLLLLLSLFALPALQKYEDFGLPASAASMEEVDEFQEAIEIDSSEAMESLELAAELFEPGAAAIGELSVESAFGDMTGDTALAADSFGELGTLFGENGNGLLELGTGAGTGNTASFFGAKVQGKRILYMLDNSGSMQNGRMETMIAELLKSVESLNPKQQFYVIFYSDTVYGLGHPQPVGGFLSANEQNKQRLEQWLETVELCGGNAVDEAIVAAEAVDPDVVFMVSDGWVRTTKSGRKYQMLLDSAGRRFTLHTLGMGCKKTEHRAQLLAIAEAHGGTFQEVEVQPAMAELSRRRPRPYRNSGNGGGLVWGTSFDQVGTNAKKKRASNEPKTL